MSGGLDSLDPHDLRNLLDTLLRAHGPQQWWPADGPFEVMVGAILTQNTSWRNVERALHNLERTGALAARPLAAASRGQVAAWIRPSGCYNVKAARLQAYCRWYLAAGGYEGLQQLPTETLRELLLGVKGVGPETADDILLYAFDRPVFVIDAYTRRVLSRLGWIRGDEPYEVLRRAVERALGPDATAFKELHALIVALAKGVCRTRPRCAACPLADTCAAAADG